MTSHANTRCNLYTQCQNLVINTHIHKRDNKLGFQLSHMQGLQLHMLMCFHIYYNYQSFPKEWNPSIKWWKWIVYLTISYRSMILDINLIPILQSPHIRRFFVIYIGAPWLVSINPKTISTYHDGCWGYVTYAPPHISMHSLSWVNTPPPSFSQKTSPSLHKFPTWVIVNHILQGMYGPCH